MLLTPHIVRTHELTEADLRPIYIGSQQNLGVGGPPPLIAAPAERRRRQLRRRAAGADAVSRGRRAPPAGARAVADRSAAGAARHDARAAARVVPGAGNVVVHRRRRTRRPRRHAGSDAAAAAARAAPAAADAGGAPPAAPPRPIDAADRPSPGSGSAQVMISPPGTDVPRRRRSVHGADLDQRRVAAVDDDADADLRPDEAARPRPCRRAASCARAARTPRSRSRSVAGRVDITIARAGDATGASGTGLLAAVLFDAVAPGSATLTLSGTRHRPGGTAMGLQFRPVTVTVQ